jgi:hypothetical protein
MQELAVVKSWDHWLAISPEPVGAPLAPFGGVRFSMQVVDDVLVLIPRELTDDLSVAITVRVGAGGPSMTTFDRAIYDAPVLDYQGAPTSCDSPRWVCTTGTADSANAQELAMLCDIDPNDVALRPPVQPSRQRRHAIGRLDSAA